MISDLPAPPDTDALLAQTRDGAQHRRLLEATNAALTASPAPALLGSVQTIHRIMLAANPQALRSSVGWWGRLLGRDIALQAESELMRNQLGVHVVQARQHLQALEESDQQLQQLGLALHTAIENLEAPSDPGRRLERLATLATSLRITATHLEMTLLNHRELAQRVDQLMPQVELLLDQQNMLRAGLSEQAAFQAATRTIETMQSLHSMTLPDVTPDDASPR